jgi:hypothetical protein
MESIANLASASSKNDILDPLSVVVKLFIYSFKPIGTKISVGNNKLSIQENTYAQGVWRRLNGDTKNDVNILLCPILYACVHYLKCASSKEKDKKDKKDKEGKEEEVMFLTIFKITLDGLVNMKQTYAGTPIVYNIEHIVNIINLFIDKGRVGQRNGKGPNAMERESGEDLLEYEGERIDEITTFKKVSLDDDDMVRINTKLNEVNSIINIDTPIYKIKENIYHHLDTAWTPHRKHILFGFVKDITEVHNVGLKSALISGLAQFMECMDIVVANVLLNNRI